MTHVLIVEDNEAERKLLRKRLEGNSFRVTAAGNGVEALAAARREPPAAIVSDVLMPKMDGFALCRAWMQDEVLKVIPFIFYSTTYLRREDKQFGLALGAVRYLIKPLDAEVLLGELRAVLQQRAGHAAPAPAAPLNDAAAQALHESALAHKIEDKVAQLEVANRKLQESEEKYRRIYDNIQDVYVEATLEGTVLEVSPQVERLSRGQYKSEDFIGKSVQEFYADPQEREAILLAIKQKGRANDMEMMFANRDGSLIPCSASATIVRGADGELRSVSTIRDITERKQAEAALARESHRNQVFLRNASDGVHILDIDGNVLEVSDSFCKMLEYSREELIGANISLWDAQWSPQELKRLIAEQIAKESLSVLETQYRRRDGSVLEVEVTGQGLELDGKPVLFNSARDITQRKAAEGKIQDYVEQIKTAFMSTVEVATTLSEMRDPYTAGHELRVAEIAVAIGAELGFDARRQEGLRVAGRLHDVGKITIPAEILSKPSKLSAIEFQLVQGHAQAGYDVLKGVEFPWLVAEVALQHHERMDGSGYPLGLKGEAILLEARIMAVADVVEAMSSHRPYRAGLGINQALAEIEHGRGKLYDAKVADACLTLFREKGYTVPT